MAHEFTTRRLVEFADTDMAGIVHFANYFRYMEACEHAFFRSLGLSVHPRDEGTFLGWARTRAECNYRRPLHYEDEVELHLTVVGKREDALDYVVSFRVDGVEVARGTHTAVCVARIGNRIKAVPMPPEVDARIEAAPATA